MSDLYEYRLTWESIDGAVAAAMEQDHHAGKNCWPLISWDALDWHEVSRVAPERSDIHEQFERLRRWAETREQPIRNVRLEKRFHYPDDEGWEFIARSREAS